jgi:hypothetical protein
MGVPTSEVGYTSAMPRREEHEVHKGHVVALEEEKTFSHTATLIHWFYISGVDAKLSEFVRNQCCNGENNYYVF